MKRKPSRKRYVALLAEECASRKISLADALSETHRRAPAHARQRVWFKLLGMEFSLSGIGQCAHRDHSTILYGARKEQRRLEAIVARAARG